MKKRILAMFLAVCTLMSFMVIGASAEGSSVNQMPDYKSLADAQPSIKLNDAPAGSTDISYGWFDGNPAIAQIEFTYDGHSYCFRAAACPADTASVDISGVNQQLSAFSTVEVSGENQVGGSYVLRYDSGSGRGLANWSSEMVETQYSLYSEDACLGKVKDMPFVKVMEMLYAYDQDAKSVSGTVLGTTDNTLALNLTNGNSVSINCEYIKTINVKNGDTVTVLYLGELDGDTKVVRILPVVGDGSFLSEGTLSGTILRYLDNLIYVLTDDENVFPFEITSSTVVTGVASTVAENEDVVVTFDGELYTDPYVPPVALEVNVTYVGAAPQPAPAPGPSYIDRYAEGVVTSIGGNWVTVNGMMFTIDGGSHIYGTPRVGCFAGISYRDYGNGYYYVIDANFANVPSPTPSPTYVDRITQGYVTAVGGIYVTVNGIVFTVNGADCSLIGTPKVGCFASISYRDFGNGNYVVLAATFTELPGPTPVPTPIPTPVPTPIPTPIPTPVPTPVPTERPIIGPAGAGWTCPNCGIRNGVQASFCANCGSPRPDTAAEHATGFANMANPFAG